MFTDTQRSGLLIDSEQAIDFSYIGANGGERQYTGYAGDSLASALLANGVLLAANAATTIAGGDGYIPEFRVRELNCHPSNSLCARDLPIYPGLRAQAYSAARPLEIAAGATRAQRANNLFADVAVVGGGLHGILAARRLVQLGLRVCLIEQKPLLGASLLGTDLLVNEQSYQLWLEKTLARLNSSSKLQQLTNCIALGFDSSRLLAHQRNRDGRDILWRLQARAVVVATGARELALPRVPDRDCPGVMLAAHVDEYWRYHGVLAGRRIVFAGNNSSIYQSALQAQDAGAQVLIVDERESVDEQLAEKVDAAGIKLLLQHKLIELKAGRERLQQIVTCPVDSRVGRQFLKCDTLATSGGWVADARLARLAERAQVPSVSVGAAAGDWSPLPQALQQSLASVQELAEQLAEAPRGRRSNKIRLNINWQNYWPGAQPLPEASAAPISENNMLAAAVPMAALATNVAPRPLMRSALHDWHSQVGAQIQERDGWLEVECYPQLTESLAAATMREATQSALNVGIHDASAQGMIAITGNSLDKFIESLAGSAVGAGACSLLPLLRADGSVLDWCQLWGLSEREYLLATNPQRLPAVWARLRQLCKHSQVILTDITHKWSVVNLSGVHSSRLLAVVTGSGNLDIAEFSCQSLPIWHDATIHCARFNLANDDDYFLLVDPSLTQLFWKSCLEAGTKAGICAFGSSARRLLQLEHGHGYLQVETALDYQPPRQLSDYRLSSEYSNSGGQQLFNFLLRGEAEVGELLMAADTVVGSLACVAYSSCGTKILALGWAEASCLTADELSVLRSDGSRVDARALLTGFADEQ